MYNLMRKKWFGPFEKLKRSSWLEVERWTWLFLNIWCLFDIILFPFLFTLFYIKHRINKVTRRSKGSIFRLAICKGNPALLKLMFLLFSLWDFTTFLWNHIPLHERTSLSHTLFQLIQTSLYTFGVQHFTLFSSFRTLISWIPSINQPRSSGCLRSFASRKVTIFYCKVVLNLSFTLFLILLGVEINFLSNNTLHSGFYQRYFAIDNWNK